MAYVDSSNGVTYWFNERGRTRNIDPWKKAAERLAADVEEYLFKDVDGEGTANPNYQNVDFLSWCVARYDACKTGSGHSWEYMKYSPDVPSLAPFALEKPVRAKKTSDPGDIVASRGAYDGPGTKYEGRIRGLEVPKEPSKKSRKKKDQQED